MTEYIWICRWEEFQTFQKKRGKPWAPPWIKCHNAQLDDERYLDLTDRQRCLLHDLRMMFAMTRGRLRHDTRTISRHRHRQTRHADLEALNHAGFIRFCSGTVREQLWNAFWNGSNLEVEVEVEVEQTHLPLPALRDEEPVENGRVGGLSENGQLPDLDYILKEIP